MRFKRSASNAGTRLKRLAKSIELLADKDNSTIRKAREVEALRRSAAQEIHEICAEFVKALNGLLPDSVITLDPPDFPDGGFLEDSPNLLQINVRGRILQIAYEATPELISTEDFRVPYTLSGFVRAFNQELLDKERIEEQLIFFTMEKSGSRWRFFDARTYRSGPFDQDYLISLMEQLI